VAGIAVLAPNISTHFTPVFVAGSQFSTGLGLMAISKIYLPCGNYTYQQLNKDSAGGKKRD
jgi:hypothetical protein